VHYIDEALNGTNSKTVPNKQGCDPEINATGIDRYRKTHTK